jgi:hypothetical protein
VFVDELIRRLVDCCARQKFACKNVTEVELTAEGGNRPGVPPTPFLELAAALYLIRCDRPLAPKLNNPVVKPYWP